MLAIALTLATPRCDTAAALPCGRRSNNWNEKLGKVSADEVALVSGSQHGDGTPLKPVTLTMVIVVFLIREMDGASVQVQGGFNELLVYHEQADDSAGTIAGGVLLNSLVVLETSQRCILKSCTHEIRIVHRIVCIVSL